MITNPNYNGFYTDTEAITRYENSKRRTLVGNPHERIVPEGFCVTCQSFTTAYNSRGECSECGTEVTADISEVKNEKS